VGDIFVHWDGRAWTPMAAGGRGLMGVWGSGRDDVWAVGFASMHHWDGQGWSSVPITGLAPPFRLNDVWGTGQKDVWAVGVQESFAGEDGRGAVLHFDGSTWSVVETGAPGHLNAISGSAANDVWIAGDGGLFHWNGSRWTAVPAAGPTRTLGSVHVRARGDLWAVGTDLIVQGDGTHWSSVRSPVFSLQDIWAAPTGDVWAAGPDGAIMRRRP
jgi:hypothetical protein